MRFLTAFFLFTAIIFAQAHSDSADILGSVTDPGGASVAGANITITDPVRGVSRTFTTDAAGEYKATAMPPGTYKVRVEATGFANQNVEGVELRVGDTYPLKTVLTLSTVATELSVTAELPVIETTRTQQASTIDTQRIENLPINRRSYLDLALTTPGVVETNDLVDGTDFRVVQSPQSGLSFGGGNGRGNGFFIDGAENYVNSGGVRPSVSQEAVREFQVNRNSFTAEFGNATGGVINIITKSGGNEVHGDLFGFLRQSALDARNYFDPGKASFTRAQYGATIGGAIRKDKTFYFVAFERLDRHETAFVPILQNISAFYTLTPSQKSLIDYFNSIPNASFQAIGAQLGAALIPANNPAVLKLFQANAGNFPFSENNNQASFRIDHRFNDNNLMFFRANLTKSFSENQQLGALIAYNRGRSLDVLDGTTMASFTHIFSPRWIGETRLMFGLSELNVVPNDKNGPQIDIEGFGAFGREIFLPSKTIDRHYQILQTFDFSTSKHSVKFGFDINPVRDTVVSETFFGGRFQFGPGVALSQLIDASAGDPNAAVGLAQLLNGVGRPDLAADLNISITSLQAYALGVPLYYQQGFGNPNWIGMSKRFNGFLQDGYKVNDKLNVNAGIRYELELNPKPVPNQYKNFGPRFGFAYNPFTDGKTVVRGGFGIFFARIDAQAANLPATLNGTQIAQSFVTALGSPTITNPLTGLPVTSIDVYQTLTAQGVIGNRGITLNDIKQFGLVPGPNAPDRVVFGIDPHFRSPYAEQASFEIERAFGDYSVSVAYEFNRGLHEIRSLDRNLYYAGRTAQNEPIFGFYNPDILQYNVLESTANSSYNAGIVQVTKRYAHHMLMNAHYTFSKALDELTDFNSDFQPQDQLNASADKALSSFNQKHRFVGTAVFDSALPGGAGKTMFQNLFGNWMLAPIIVASSGRPFNLLTGFDSFGDNHDTTHRPFGAGRNIGKGPDFFSTDLRLSRKFGIGHDGKRTIEFTVEGFNLMNRTNFRSVNNVVGTTDLSQVPGLTGRRVTTDQPLAFTSAFDPREIQFGLKINF